MVSLKDVEIEISVFERSYWKLKEKDAEIISLKAKVEALVSEVNILRLYMNNDTEAMADERLDEIQRDQSLNNNN